jgi:hypothetical protein
MKTPSALHHLAAAQSAGMGAEQPSSLHLAADAGPLASHRSLSLAREVRKAA